MNTLSLGFSPCPNDTFMFHDLVHDLVPVPDVSWRSEILDIEALNLAALESPPRLDVTKVSLPALAASIDDYAVLSTGAALGRNCGPLVVARSADEVAALSDLAGKTVAIPGANTTAFLLLRILGPSTIQPKEMRFDEIMPAVETGDVDAGLIIHESRFTYLSHDLREVADLGVLWESTTGLPLPLGVIAARRSLPDDLVAAIEAALGTSVASAFAHPDRSAAWVRQHAQELDPDVCRAHIALYVNEFSVDLGVEGRSAIEELLSRGRSVGLLRDGREPWR